MREAEYQAVAKQAAVAVTKYEILQIKVDEVVQEAVARVETEIVRQYVILLKMFAYGTPLQER